MDIQHFTYEAPTCPCGAQLGTGHPTLCRKCVAWMRWNRRHQARGGHGGRGPGHPYPSDAAQRQPRRW
ncbi:hypothetical protein Ato02nite_074720 [Paractinoplanes toevensis]|uniref:Uncharacterized protein n=1 Tax=Paractinoplanes toevensis TaxID=571911 RepID=A0A919TGN2_9ACTN|nr:hypothetical protein Ato02nite_074720 [Actinoplanes toevensis]